MGGINMKVTELMLGDWVVYDDIPSQVTMTSAEGDVMVLKEGKVVFTNSEQLNPIPLTEELLKVNDFKLSMYYAIDGRQMYTHEESNFTLYFSRKQNIYNVSRTDVSVQLQYVHELQHYLRLINLQGLAVNFKIK